MGTEASHFHVFMQWALHLKGVQKISYMFFYVN